MSRNSFVTNLCPSFKEKQKKRFVNKRTIYWHPWNLSSCFNPRIGSVNVKDQTLLQDLQPALHFYWLAGIRSMEHFLRQRFFFLFCANKCFMKINIDRCVLSSISGWDERFSNHRSRIKRVRRTMAQDRIKCLKHCLSPYDFFSADSTVFSFFATLQQIYIKCESRGKNTAKYHPGHNQLLDYHFKIVIWHCWVEQKTEDFLKNSFWNRCKHV